VTILQLPEDITSLFPDNLNIDQISGEAITIINKIYRQEQLNKQDLDTLLNPTEVAALLSAKYQQPVNHRYVKEITREVKNQKTGHTTPARLTHDKIAGRTYLYKTKKVLDVKLRQKARVSPLHKEASTHEGEIAGEAA
jgi:signal recognition particle GTPase